MCGLFGVLGTSVPSSAVENTLLLADLSKYRGRDATGIGIIHERNNKVVGTYKKDTVPSGVFIEDPDVKSYMKSVGHTYAHIGHTRQGSVGANTRKNAQPFCFGHILGTHNGTMSAYNIDSEMSDSHYFWKDVADVGFKKAIEKAEERDASYALVWFDAKQATINMYRNARRPLYTMRSGNLIYYSSLRLFLDFLQRTVNGSYGAITEVDTGTIYTRGLTENKWVEEKWRPKKVHTVPVHHYGTQVAPWETSWETMVRQDIERRGGGEDTERFQSYTPHWKQRRDRNLEKKREKQEKQNNKPFPKEDRIIVLQDQSSGRTNPEYSYYGYTSKKLPVAEIVKFLRDTSCYVCTNHSTIGENIWWKGPESYLCNHCYNSAFVREMEVGDHKNEKAFEDLFIKGVLKAEAA